MSSNKSTSNANTKLILGGSIVAGLAALAGVLYWTTQKSKSSSGSAEKRAEKPAVVVEDGESDDEEPEREAKLQSDADEKLQERVHAALDILRHRFAESQMDPSQLPHLIQKEDTDLLTELLSMDPSKYNKASRKSAVDFICCYYEFIAMGQDFSEFTKFTLNGESDAALTKAWSLLAVADAADEEEDEAAARSAVVAKLDVAQRLFNSDRLVSLYQQIYKDDFEQLTNEELVALFGVAPVLGQYSVFRKLGTLLRERDHEGFLSFHSEAIHRDTVPSYFLAFFQSLEDLPKDYSLASFSSQQPLELSIHQITAVMSLESDVRSPNPEVAEEVKKALKAQVREGEWVDVANPIPLLMFGGLASSRAIDDYSAPLCGFVTRDGKSIKMMSFRPEFQVGMQFVQFVEMTKNEEVAPTTNAQGQTETEWLITLRQAQYVLHEPEIFVPQITGSKAPSVLRAMQKLKAKVTTLGSKSSRD